MKTKNIIRNLSVILVLLIVLYLSKLVFFSDNKRIEGYNENIINFKKELLNKVIINSNENKITTTIVKTGKNSFKVLYNSKEYQGTYKNIEPLIDDFFSLKSQRVVSKNKDKLKEFGLKKGKYSVKFEGKDGGVLGEYIIGNKSEDGSFSFIRESSSNISKAIPNSLFYYLSQKEDFYINKDLYKAIGSNMIKEIKYNYQGKQLDVTYKEDQDKKMRWFLKEGQKETELDEENQRKMVSSSTSLSFISGDGIVKNTDNYKKENSTFTVSLTSSEKKPRAYNLYFFKEQSSNLQNKQYVVLAQGDNILKSLDKRDVLLTISEYKFRQIFRYFTEDEN